MLVEHEDGEVEFQAMHMNKGNKKCRWPRQLISRRVVLLNVLLKINDPVYYHPGKYYELQDAEIDAMKIRFADYKKRLKPVRDLLQSAHDNDQQDDLENVSQE